MRGRAGVRFSRSTAVVFKVFLFFWFLFLNRLVLLMRVVANHTSSVVPSVGPVKGISQLCVGEKLS